MMMSLMKWKFECVERRTCSCFCSQNSKAGLSVVACVSARKRSKDCVIQDWVDVASVNEELGLLEDLGGRVDSKISFVVDMSHTGEKNVSSGPTIEGPNMSQMFSKRHSPSKWRSTESYFSHFGGCEWLLWELLGWVGLGSLDHRLPDPERTRIILGFKDLVLCLFGAVVDGVRAPSAGSRVCFICRRRSVSFSFRAVGPVISSFVAVIEVKGSGTRGPFVLCHWS